MSRLIDRSIWLNAATLGFLLEQLVKCEILSQEQVDEIINKAKEQSDKIVDKWEKLGDVD